MDDASIQRLWAQLEGELFCGDCKACRPLIWELPKYYDDRPRDSIVRDKAWVAIHCDYFRRRVEFPEELRRCGAHQKKK
ncbi:MAG: hypothetical protein DSZ28_01695 [Thiothrix sp.]|nr:MAG: hypothetical protein DSZ28_01695 [Thiothrix sp.]